MDIALINISDISQNAQKINHDYFISVKAWETQELKLHQIPA